MKPIFSAIQAWLINLFSFLKFGTEIQPRNWNNLFLSGSDTSDTGIIMFGGLSANASHSLIKIARSLYKYYGSRNNVWSLNLSGHTGKYRDFTKSRFWFWILDAKSKLNMLSVRFKKKNAILIGHSTGGLVVLALILLNQIQVKVKKIQNNNYESKINLKAILLFPAFRLKSRKDEILLLVVAIMYYAVCPMTFVYLATKSISLFIFSCIAIFLHYKLVPRIWIPSGENRVQTRKKPWFKVSELVLLSGMCIFFITMPLVVLISQAIIPNYSQTIFGVFIFLLLSSIFMIPQRDTEDKCKTESKRGYDYLPLVATSNLILLQILLRPFLTFAESPILIIESSADTVVDIRKSWIRDLSRKSNLVFVTLHKIPHSQWGTMEQSEIANIIVRWIERQNSLQ